MRKIPANFQISRQITAKFLIFLLTLSNSQSRVISIFGVEIDFPSYFSKTEETKFISLSENAIVEFLANLTLPFTNTNASENVKLVELQDYDGLGGLGPIDGGGGGGDSPILVAVNAIEVPTLDKTPLFQEVNALLSPYLGDGGSRELIFGAVQNILAGGLVGFFSRTFSRNPAGTRTQTTIAPSRTRTRMGTAPKTTVKPKPRTRTRATTRIAARTISTARATTRTITEATAKPTTTATTPETTTEAPATTSTVERLDASTKSGGYKVNRMRTKNRTSYVSYGFDEYFQ